MTAKRSSYYLTTPIYYVNDVPHLGTAYTTLAADVMARYRRMLGHDVYFLTGLDEHGQKVEQAATAAGMTPQEWVDDLAPKFADAWKMLNINYDVFMRTTDGAHKKSVQAFAARLYENGDIYSGNYEGWYCLPDETYWAESDIEMPEDSGEGGDVAQNEGAVPNCPDCNRPLQFVREKNWFFRLSKYTDFLIDHYENNPQAMGPDTRRNEILSFLRSGLHDLSISRANVEWGIPLPWTEDSDDPQTMYVWFDALINYITAIGFGAGTEADDEEFAYRWPAQVHYVGKDIIRFHCIIWPAMLHAAGLALPKTVYAHGFLLTKGEKMSKSRGNAMTPAELVDRFGVDGYRYYFMRDVSFGVDGSISDEAMVQRFNGDLANDWGNLCSRLFSMVGKYCEGVAPAYVGDIHAEDAEGAALRDVAAELFARVEDAMNRFDYSGALNAIWDLVRAANRYLEDSAPWGLAKDPEKADQLANVLYSTLEACRVVALYTAATMPETSDEVMSRLGLGPATAVIDLEAAAKWGQLPAGNTIRKGDPLFQRLESTT
ncbi:MAG: methionine--tRNA ligase [Coriobacteriia bacterium]|nr:methionine--tRNA ligase [Coriobacteriia bacterium]MCL2870359.1 methionine--tRNA ligase [Coriobacteriia bacterium]